MLGWETFGRCSPFVLLFTLPSCARCDDGDRNTPGAKVTAEPPATETTAEQTRKTKNPPPSERSRATHLAGYPNGYAVVGLGDRCELVMRGIAPEDGWTRQLKGCDGMLEVSAASNSNAYARTPTRLYAFDPKGKLLWDVKVEPVPEALLTPDALLDSSVVTLESRNLVVAYSPTGERAWTFKIDGEEKITAAPIASRTEGTLVVTNAAVYAIGADGNIRWRGPFE